jgi:hypothetical protein
MPPEPAPADRATCAIRRWRVFGPGFHKGELYSPERCRQIAANFARLAGVLTPAGKLGHDRSQRLLASLGFPNVGTVTRCEADADGVIDLDLDGVPAEIGGEVSAGRLNSGSVELRRAVPDPADPARALPGDVLVAVALLGEEQPAVPGFSPPRATFPDGTEVPPSPTAAPWLAAMAGVVRAAARAAGPDPDPSTVICFAEMFQMSRDQIIAALKAKGVDVLADPSLRAKSDEELKALLARPAADDQTPAWFRSFADRADRCMADLTRRVGAVEADRTAKTAAAADEKEQAFAAEVARVVDQACERGHVLPWQKTAFVAHGRTMSPTRVFADGAHRGRTEFAVWADHLTAGGGRPFGDTVPDGHRPGSAALTAGGRALLGTLAITNPRVVRQLAGA